MPFTGVNPPKEPANYDPANKYKDPVAYYKHREAVVAEEFVKIAEAKVGIAHALSLSQRHFFALNLPWSPIWCS